MRSSRQLLVILIFAISLFGCEQRQYLPLLANKPSQESNDRVKTAEPTLLIQEMNNTVVPFATEGVVGGPPSDAMLLPHIVQSNNKTLDDWWIERAIISEQPSVNTIIELEFPVLKGEISPGLLSFSELISAIIKNEKDLFARKFYQSPDIVRNTKLRINYQIVSSSTWSFDNSTNQDLTSQIPTSAKDAVISPDQGILSLLISIQTDLGEGLPIEHHIGINYDVTQGRLLEIGDVFLPNTNYIGTMAEYCIRELSQRGTLVPAMIYNGASADAKNYQIWNLTAEGILITFEENQVGPMLSGTQSVLIPYNHFQVLLDPMGPLSHFSK